MSDDALLQMWGPFRKSLIESHLFYVEQARTRLLSQLDDIDSEADRAAEEWLRQVECHFDPDRPDPSDFYDQAREIRFERGVLLAEMRDQTCLSVVAGMFHEWDKRLRDWLTREVQQWHRGDKAILKIWSATFEEIVELLQAFGWNVRGAGYFPSLDACRLVVNVYKHGHGSALERLMRLYPQYLGEAALNPEELSLRTRYRVHTDLRVTDDQFAAFSDAIVAFWRDVPETVFASADISVPDWFGKAILRDRAARTRVA